MKNYSIMKTAIRATVFIAIYLLFALTTAASGVAGHELTGHWLGSLMAGPGVQLRLTLEITRTAAGKMEGVLTSVDQGNARIPLSALSVKDGVVHLEATSIGAMFDGKLDPAGSEIGGDWKQGGASLPLVFKRQTQPANFSVNRPQEPKKPYPYTDEEVVGAAGGQVFGEEAGDGGAFGDLDVVGEAAAVVVQIQKTHGRISFEKKDRTEVLNALGLVRGIVRGRGLQRWWAGSVNGREP